MDITIIQAILVFVVAFIRGIDQFSFLESLYQPIVTCPIIGAILGNFELGIVVGGAYQLIQIGSMPIGGAQPQPSQRNQQLFCRRHPVYPRRY